MNPHVDSWKAARNMIRAHRLNKGYATTHLADCQEHDLNGLHPWERRGEITPFTGLDGPSRATVSRDIELFAVERSSADSVWTVVQRLQRRGYVRPGPTGKHISVFPGAR